MASVEAEAVQPGGRPTCTPLGASGLAAARLDSVAALEEGGASGRRYLPKLSKPGYSTCPPIDELMQMSEEQLRAVDRFAVFNCFGKVEFAEPTDVTFQDLDSAVTIAPGSIEVYPDEEGQPYHSAKPPVGHKLNKPAKLHYYGWELPSFAAVVRQARRMGAAVADYSPAEQRLAVSVEHFTKFEFREDDEEISEDPDSQIGAHKISKNVSLPMASEAKPHESAMKPFALPTSTGMDIERNPLAADGFDRHFFIFDGINQQFPRLSVKQNSLAPTMQLNSQSLPINIAELMPAAASTEVDAHFRIAKRPQASRPEDFSHPLDFEIESLVRELEVFDFAMPAEAEENLQSLLTPEDLGVIDSACLALDEYARLT